MDPIKDHICRSCRLRLNTSRPIRSFSTSSTLRVVPPESPYYVDIPTSHQAFAPYTAQPKGTLPTPRDPFPANRPERSSSKYIANVIKDPLKKNVKPMNKLSAVGQHKVKMAEMRKSQLREGLTSLLARKQAELNAMSARSQAKQRERAQLLNQAEREDARLTNTSIPSSMKPDAQTSIATLESEVAVAKRIHAEKVANYERHVQAKNAEKMDALHTLYMNARNFVTTEKQLAELLKAQFDNKQRFVSDVSAGDSLWNLGPPDSIKDMIADATNRPRTRSNQTNIDMLSSLSSLASTRRLARNMQGEADRISKDQDRLKKIAEKLSGGKI